MNARFGFLIVACCFLRLASPAYGQAPSAKIARSRFQSDSAKGNWLGALSQLKAFKRLTDSTTAIQHQQQLTQLENAHDLQKKNRDVEFNTGYISLLRRQTALQNQALKNEQIIRNLLLGGVSMLLLLLAISYNRYKLKTRTNNVLQYRQREISGQNNALKQLVAEKEWLLKEIHHRVKNNLQLVISLLNSQVADIKNESAAILIRDSKNRMNAISMIHQRLFKSDAVSGIDMVNYISELTYFLRDSFGNSDQIEFAVYLEPLNLNVSQAVPLGLIINEAITNAIKYAFPVRQAGTISVRIRETADKAINLIISDNGTGLRDGFDITTSNTLGVSLMLGLAEQIKGKLRFINDDGLTLELTFKKTEL